MARDLASGRVQVELPTEPAPTVARPPGKRRRIEWTRSGAGASKRGPGERNARMSARRGPRAPNIGPCRNRLDEPGGRARRPSGLGGRTLVQASAQPTPVE
jgi:hypothetical protein